MSDVANKTSFDTGEQVRIVRRTLRNGNKGVAITITIDQDNLADFAFAASVVERIALEHNTSRSPIIRTLLATALSEAASRMDLPGNHRWVAGRYHWDKASPLFCDPNGHNHNWVTVLNREDFERGIE